MDERVAFRSLGLWLATRMPVPVRWLHRLGQPTRGVVAGVVMLLLIGAVGWLMVVGTVGSRLHEVADPARFASAFFLSAVVPTGVFLLAWYLSSVRSDPTRAREYIFLRSQPFSVRDLHAFLVVAEVARFSWLPLGLIVLMVALTDVAPVPFLIRFFILISGAYILLQLGGLALHFLRGPDRCVTASYPVRSTPVVQLVLVIAYAAVIGALVLSPGVATGVSFWVVLGAAASIGVALFRLSRALFERNHADFLIVGAPSTTGMGGYAAWMRRMVGRSSRFIVNPFLLKSIVRITREEAVISHWLPAAIFIALTFLIARNNQSIEDGATIMLAMFSLGVMIVTIRTMSRFGVDQEAPELIYSLPVTPRQLYISLMLPAAAGLIGASLVLSLFVYASGNIVLATTFMGKALLVVAIVLSIGAGAGVSGYPSAKAALRRFIAAMLILAVFFLLLYRYRMLVATVTATVITTLAMKKKLFNES